ncbi:hypothetical protein CC2G_008249 [Coprinopsis cinerea AmutBmut pab1-1]|nr:hypothetical protein CC2G_008249 [Coprinopsis cinerea AmutBmut pab1-1]
MSATFHVPRFSLKTPLQINSFPTRQDEQGLDDEVLAVLVRYYGFVPPLPMPTDRPTVALPEPQRVWLLRTLASIPPLPSPARFPVTPVPPGSGFLGTILQKISTDPILTTST